MFSLTRIFSIITLSIFVAMQTVAADESFVQRKDVQFFINKMVKYYGFNRDDIVSNLRQVQLQPKVIESISHPYEKKTWDVYKTLFLTKERLQLGLRFWTQNMDILNKVEKQYGIPPEVIIATIGIETIYGKHQGDYRVIDALSTLAFNYPPRAAFFNKELTEFFILCKEQKVSPTQYLGSYAGAMGKTQFMPSSYRNFAVDFDHKGRSDLMNSDADAIASVANYYAKHHWIPNQIIAEAVDVNGNGYKNIDSKLNTPGYFVKDLVTIGIKPQKFRLNRPVKAGLLALENVKYTEYWFLYNNFYVITRYNTSPQYAMAVTLLADEIKHYHNLGYDGSKPI